MAFLISKHVDCHHKELGTLVEVSIYVRSSRAADVKSALSEGFRPSLVASKNSKLVSHSLEAFLNSFTVMAILKEFSAFFYYGGVKAVQHRCFRIAGIMFTVLQVFNENGLYSFKL